MILIDNICNNIYDEFSRLYELAEPRSNNWLICKSVWIVIGLIGAYLYIVKVSGPAFMKKRKPYNLKNILIVYNIVQILFNLCLFYMSLNLWLWKYKFICQPIDYSNNPDSIKVLNIMWYYFMLKVFDIMDTFFFILRKKTNQVTGLHMYHHSGMIIAVWMAIKFVPGGHVLFLGVINAVVHVIMYSYYLFTSWNTGEIWWKKYVTQLQIIQFIIIFSQHLLAILKTDCDFPKLPLIIFLPHNLFLLILFIKFYIRTYGKKQSSEIDQNEVSNKMDDNRIKPSNEKSKLVTKIE